MEGSRKSLKDLGNLLASIGFGSYGIFATVAAVPMGVVMWSSLPDNPLAIIWFLVKSISYALIAAAIVWIVLRLLGTSLIALGNWYPNFIYDPKFNVNIDLVDGELILRVKFMSEHKETSLSVAYEDMVTLDNGHVFGRLGGVSPYINRYYFDAANMKKGEEYQQVIGRQNNNNFVFIMGAKNHNKEYPLQEVGIYVFRIIFNGMHMGKEYAFHKTRMIRYSIGGQLKLLN